MRGSAAPPAVEFESWQPGPMDSSRRVRLLDGTEKFTDDEGRDVASVLDFWSWSSSDLVGNSLRGVLAEFLVGRALGVDPRSVRVEWDAWDMVLTDGTTVEVKSASYWQSWKQSRPSEIRFDVAEHQSWNSETDTFDEEKSRPADVYVFCVLGFRDNPNLDPLDLSEWDFHVVSGATIDNVVGNQKSIGLGQLISRLEPRHASFAGLADAVAAEAEVTRRSRGRKQRCVSEVDHDAAHAPDQPPR